MEPRDSRGTALLIGLGLVGAGVTLGGAGFAVLYACREGTNCHQDKTVQTVGWVLAAPGILPLVVGAVLVYGSVGGRSRGGGGGVFTAPQSLPRWSVGLAPLPGGGAVSAGYRW